MTIEPMPRDDFNTALAFLTGGDLSRQSDQAVANLMVLATCVHALAFNEATRRGWCGMSDTGKPIVTYPAWPEGVNQPEMITAEDPIHA